MDIESSPLIRYPVKRLWPLQRTDCSIGCFCYYSFTAFNFVLSKLSNHQLNDSYRAYAYLLCMMHRLRPPPLLLGCLFHRQMIDCTLIYYCLLSPALGI
jgi:hypothetical protein